MRQHTSHPRYEYYRRTRLTSVYSAGGQNGESNPTSLLVVLIAVALIGAHSDAWRCVLGIASAGHSAPPLRLPDGRPASRDREGIRKIFLENYISLPSSKMGTERGTKSREILDARRESARSLSASLVSWYKQVLVGFAGHPWVLEPGSSENVKRAGSAQATIESTLGRFKAKLGTHHRM